MTEITAAGDLPDLRERAAAAARAPFDVRGQDAEGRWRLIFIPDLTPEEKAAIEAALIPE